MSDRQKAWTVTGFRRDEAGVYRARVTEAGQTVEVDRLYGSWQAVVRTAPHSREFVRRELRRDVAADLAGKVREIEERERRAEKARLAAEQMELEVTA